MGKGIDVGVDEAVKVYREDVACAAFGDVGRHLERVRPFD